MGGRDAGRRKEGRTTAAERTWTKRGGGGGRAGGGGMGEEGGGKAGDTTRANLNPCRKGCRQAEAQVEACYDLWLQIVLSGPDKLGGTGGRMRVTQFKCTIGDAVHKPQHRVLTGIEFSARSAFRLMRSMRGKIGNPSLTEQVLASIKHVLV